MSEEANEPLHGSIRGMDEDDSWDEYDRLYAAYQQLFQERDADTELLRWVASYLIPGEGKDDLIRAIHKRLGITGHVTDI